MSAFDFSSALYLGFRQVKGRSGGPKRLTTGKPAALAEPPIAQQVADKIAHLQGLERGLVYPSTLHLFWDLFNFLKRKPVVFFLDDKTYPIARWGMESAVENKTIIRRFAHHSVKGLKKALQKFSSAGHCPIVLTDGFCPQCGKGAPILPYLELIKALGGLLVIDDTQALGVLGRRPSLEMPYGYGGGGVLPWMSAPKENVLTGCSLAKAFGTPMAVMSGSGQFIGRIKRKSLTRIHCSPPSLITLDRARRMLSLNRSEGDRMRRQLLTRVRLFKAHLQAYGLRATNDFFPVQQLKGMSQGFTRKLFEKLHREGVQCILTANHYGRPEITFLLRADQSPEEVTTTTALMLGIIKRMSCP